MSEKPTSIQISHADLAWLNEQYNDSKYPHKSDKLIAAFHDYRVMQDQLLGECPA